MNNGELTFEIIITSETSSIPLPGVADSASTLKLLFFVFTFCTTSVYAYFPFALCASSITINFISFTGKLDSGANISDCTTCGVTKKTLLLFHNKARMAGDCLPVISIVSDGEIPMIL